ncbi:MAG TPA: hypothetical protein VFF52_27300 [Isosphaeraceae bacterium]|nr:hypothetical protein [Isosphaeraceae bacterium]
MGAGRNDRPIRRHGLRVAAWALPMLAAWIGCATLGDRGKALVPTRNRIRTGSFLLFSNAPMAENAPAVRCLRALEHDLRQHLAFQPPLGDDPVEIYVLDDREAFAHFLQFYYPELPPRRAFFLAQGQDRVVYTYASPRLEEDLRHEATHALVRGAYGDLPLWLDEGLAEYFESDLAQADIERRRIAELTNDLHNTWSPNLERLESLNDIRQMTPRDYREAWAWVDLLLNGPEPGRSLLMGYLGEAGRAPKKTSLSSRLSPAGLTNDRLVAYLQNPQAGAVAGAGSAQPAREPGSFRLQDRPIEPAPLTRPRGLLRRLGAWLGL